MLHPIRNEPYRFNRVPLTPKEKKQAAKKGEPTKAINGVFRFRGVKGTRKMVLIFQAPATVEDGVVYAGRRVALTADEFALGLDLNKIRGRAKRVKAA